MRVLRERTHSYYIHVVGTKRRRQRRRTAGCNKVYFSRYYVKLASLAELELFKKHSAAVVAVGSLNMHGGKCPSPDPPFRPAPTHAPAPPCCLPLPQKRCPRACNYPCTFADVAEWRRYDRRCIVSFFSALSLPLLPPRPRLLIVSVTFARLNPPRSRAQRSQMLRILNQRIMQTSAKLAFEKFNFSGCTYRDMQYLFIFNLNQKLCMLHARARADVKHVKSMKQKG